MFNLRAVRLVGNRGLSLARCSQRRFATPATSGVNRVAVATSRARLHTPQLFGAAASRLFSSTAIHRAADDGSEAEHILRIPPEQRQTGDDPIITETVYSAESKTSTGSSDFVDTPSPLEAAQLNQTASAPGRRATASKPTAPPAGTPPIKPVIDQSKMPRVNLTTPFIKLSPPEKQFVPSTSTRVTVLPNGLRVATHESASPITNIGVFIDTGSRYETPNEFGINHFIEHMSFKSTQKSSDKELVRQMSKIGANVMCTSFREISILSGEVLFDHVPTVLNTFADIILRPAFKPDELAESRAKYRDALADRDANVEMGLMDATHAAAYQGNTLGQGLYAPEENLEKFTAPVLRDFLRKWYTPKRMVVAAVGVPHDVFVDFVQTAFRDLPKDQVATTQRAPAIYTGGEDLNDNAELTDGLSQFILAFETASWHSPDLVPMCVLQMMMGGGGSFSSGGPGKGMYSRLYSNVLNKYGFAKEATSFNSIHTDSGLFGISGTTQPENLPAMVEVIINELRNMTGGNGSASITALELSRAKTQLKSSVFMQLESRSLLLEDIGRQLITYGDTLPTTVKTPFEIGALIDAVSPDDIVRVAHKMLRTKPTIVAAGALANFPTPEQITMRLMSD